MNTILDLSVVVILALFAFGGYKKGLVFTIVGMIGSVIAASIASVVASLMSVNVYAQFVMPRVIETAADLTKDISSTLTAAETSEKVFSVLPDYAINILDMIGIGKNSLAMKITDTGMELPQLIESLIRPTMIHLVTVIITMAVYVILTVVFSIVAGMITKTSDGTILGLINRLGGLGIGILSGLVTIMVLALGIYMLTILLPAADAQTLSDGINNSIFYKLLNEHNIPDLIISKLTIS